MRRWYALLMAVFTGAMIIVSGFIFAWVRG
jgi:hypothetical protein